MTDAVIKSPLDGLDLTGIMNLLKTLTGTNSSSTQNQNQVTNQNTGTNVNQNISTNTVVDQITQQIQNMITQQQQNQTTNQQTAGTQTGTGTSDQASQVALDSLKQILPTLQGQLNDPRYSKEAAIADSQGGVNNIIKNLTEQQLPSVFQAEAATGGYGGTTKKLLSNDLSARAAGQAQALVAQNVANYAGIQSNQTKDLLTAVSNAVNAQRSGTTTQAGTNNQNTTGGTNTTTTGNTTNTINTNTGTTTNQNQSNTAATSTNQNTVTNTGTTTDTTNPSIVTTPGGMTAAGLLAAISAGGGIDNILKGAGGLAGWLTNLFKSPNATVQPDGSVSYPNGSGYGDQGGWPGDTTPPDAPGLPPGPDPGDWGITEPDPSLDWMET